MKARIVCPVCSGQSFEVEIAGGMGAEPIAAGIGAIDDAGCVEVTILGGNYEAHFRQHWADGTAAAALRRKAAGLSGIADRLEGVAL